MANEIPSDLFRSLASAKTAAQLDQLLSEFVGTPTDELREVWRKEQQAISRILRSMEGIPARLEAHMVNHLAAVAKGGAAEALTEAAARHRYWEFSVQATRVNEGLERNRVVAKLVVELDWAPIGCHATIQPSPADLISRCWLQLAEAVRALTNERPEQVCERCGSKFAPKRKGSENAPVRFCSAKCRMAAAYAAKKAGES